MLRAALESAVPKPRKPSKFQCLFLLLDYGGHDFAAASPADFVGTLQHNCDRQFAAGIPVAFPTRVPAAVPSCAGNRSKAVTAGPGKSKKPRDWQEIRLTAAIPYNA
jgi:hypothetical protein